MGKWPETGYICRYLKRFEETLHANPCLYFRNQELLPDFNISKIDAHIIAQFSRGHKEKWITFQTLFNVIVTQILRSLYLGPYTHTHLR